MKVAVVCPYDIGRPGGVQDQATRLVQWLRQASHEAWLVAPGAGGPEGTISVGSAAEIPINRSIAPVAMDLDVPKAVAAAVAGADVVHIHEPFVPMVGAAALLAETPPKVATFHADPSNMVRGLYRVGSPLLRRWTGRARVVTAVSPVAAAAVKPFAEARLIPNGVDLAEYAELDVLRRPHRMVFLGRDEPRKGLDVALAAWSMIREQIPDAELHVVGAQRESVVEGVHWLGFVPESLKRRELAAAAVYCAPHTGGESFGIVLVEAMAAGCAVVASDLESFNYVLADAGMLVPPGDPRALAETVVQLLQNEDVVAELSKRGRTRASTFDRSRVLELYLQAYEDALT